MSKGGPRIISQSAKQLLVGREFTEQELADVRETVAMFSHLSRYELVLTICEHLDWVTLTGRYKRTSCWQLLQKLAAAGEIVLPAGRRGFPPPRRAAGEWTGEAKAPPVAVEGELSAFPPVELEPVQDREAIELWNEYIARYHPLGYKRPFGAHQRYFIRSGEERWGCFLLAAAAWALAARDQWIGWTAADRAQRLNGVVNNTRFLVFPWVKVPNLGSKALALVARRLGRDWQARYGYAPVLLETFVDERRYDGTCYRAANWLEVGVTAGRGRMDRHTRYLSRPKRIYVYPLVSDFRAYLCGQRPYRLQGRAEVDGDEW